MNWDDRYREPGFAYGVEPNDFLVSVAPLFPKGRILSLAEGEGRNAVYLAGLGHDVTAVDASLVGLQKAQELAARKGVAITTLHADLAEFEIGESQWDGIVACYCHLPSAIRLQVHAAVVRGLKPGGRFVLEGFSKDQLAYDTGGPKSLDMLMSVDELKQELTGLDFLRAVQLEREVVEGTKHTGRASVVQVLAAKPL